MSFRNQPYPPKSSRRCLIPPALQSRLDTLIDLPKEFGSGIFDPERQCLLGIISAKVVKYANQKENGRLVWAPNGFAGYFVSRRQDRQISSEGSAVLAHIRHVHAMAARRRRPRPLS